MFKAKTFRERNNQLIDDVESTPKIDHSKFNQWNVSDKKITFRPRVSTFATKASRKRKNYKHKVSAIYNIIEFFIKFNFNI